MRNERGIEIEYSNNEHTLSFETQEVEVQAENGCLEVCFDGNRVFFTDFEIDIGLSDGEEVSIRDTDTYRTLTLRHGRRC